MLPLAGSSAGRSRYERPDPRSAGQDRGDPADQSQRRIKNDVAATFFLLSFGMALVPLIWVLWIVIERGWYAIAQPGWWSHSLRGVLPEQFAGGVYHALYGTVAQAAVAAIIAVPLGFMTAVYLAEYRSGRLARFTTFMVDVLAGLPSIVAALFVFSLWIATMGFEQSAFAVSLALVLLMLPVVVRSSEEMLRLVPQDLREASYALGIPKWKTVMRIVVPSRDAGHRHRRAALDRTGDGRNRPGVGVGRLQPVDQFRHLQRQHGVVAVVDLLRTQQPRTRRLPEGVGRSTDTDHRGGGWCTWWPRWPTG